LPLELGGGDRALVAGRSVRARRRSERATSQDFTSAIVRPLGWLVGAVVKHRGGGMDIGLGKRSALT